MVPGAGIEPARYFYRGILSLTYWNIYNNNNINRTYSKYYQWLTTTVLLLVLWLFVCVRLWLQQYCSNYVTNIEGFIVPRLLKKRATWGGRVTLFPNAFNVPVEQGIDPPRLCVKVVGNIRFISCHQTWQTMSDYTNSNGSFTFSSGTSLSAIAYNRSRPKTVVQYWEEKPVRE